MENKKKDREGKEGVGKAIESLASSSKLCTSSLMLTYESTSHL